ncbi:hypothetical protein PC39_15349 [Salinisphaera sp. PC39]|uniref:NRDE family protein n=1 Tax=Salinisphaera sp. PC39 TaxID=1304156 RepID=UPI0033418130
MCLIAFAWRAHPRYDLVVAANRDEFHARPTEAAHAWPDAPRVFAGRDGSAGGTWCGVTPDGRFAAVTNVREPDPPRAGQLSRGALVADFLAGEAGARAFCDDLLPKRFDYGAFNLLAGDREGLYYVGNRDDRGILAVPPGVHALSNGVFGDVWPKTRRAERLLGDVLAHDEIEVRDLQALLYDETEAPDGDLPDTGVDTVTERALSPIFIRGRQYGTRAATVVLRDADSVRLVERGFGPDGVALHTVDRTLTRRQV